MCVFVCCICVLVFVCGCYVFPSRCAEKAAGGAGDLQRRKGCAVSRGSAPEKPKALGVEMSVRTLGGTFGDIFFLLLSRIIHMCLLACCLLPVFLFFLKNCSYVFASSSSCFSTSSSSLASSSSSLLSSLNPCLAWQYFQREKPFLEAFQGVV